MQHTVQSSADEAPITGDANIMAAITAVKQQDMVLSWLHMLLLHDFYG